MMPALIVRPERTNEGVVLRSEDFAVTFRGEGLRDEGGNSAAITALPVAMRLGRPLRIEAPVCPELRVRLGRVAGIWSTWRPDLFAPVPIEAPEAQVANLPAGRPALMAYSGGVDSTHALRRLSEGGLRPDLLTVLGMDYRRSDPGRFERLLERTLPFREAHAGRQFVVESDAASVMRRFDIDAVTGFGFHVYACLHLFEPTHARGLMAADYAAFQELLVGPHGTTSAVNPLFASRGMTAETLDLDMTRGDKAAALAGDPLALSALSFCKDDAVRPDNCGVCTKCVRTKAMFHAATGTVPPIFRDMSFDPASMRGLDLSRRTERVFALDMLRIARERGRGAEFEPLLTAIAAHKGPASLRHRLYTWRNRIASRLGAR